MRVLLAEDTKELATALRYALAHNKYGVDVVSTGTEALEYALTGAYDIILLDIMMPGMDGIEVLKQFRKKGFSTPVLILSAKSDLGDRIHGLDCGADDYLGKPFAVMELLARMRALLRRNENYLSDVLTFGNLNLDSTSYELHTDAGTARLNTKEFQLMSCFMRNPLRVFSAEELMEKIWGWDSAAEINVIWTNIAYLRRKLEQLQASVQIQSLRGAGYRLIEKLQTPPPSQ